MKNFNSLCFCALTLLATTVFSEKKIEKNETKKENITLDKINTIETTVTQGEEEISTEKEPTLAPVKQKRPSPSDEPLSQKASLPANMKFKAIKKSTLKTQLPFHSFCGSKLTNLPPNQQLALAFAQETAIQSFTYDYKLKHDQWYQLEKCYTELGWKSFETAMSRSGNNQSVVDERLFVKATIDGEVQLLEEDMIAPSWKVMVPIKVRYENDTHYLEQFLKVKLVISLEKQRLGVDQIIASPILKTHKYEQPLDTFKASMPSAH